MSRFKSIDITNFDDCIGCPFSYEESTARQDFKMCDKLGRIIIEYRTELFGEDQDYRNKEGVLNDCPFLKSNEITFTDEEMI